MMPAGRWKMEVDAACLYLVDCRHDFGRAPLEQATIEGTLRVIGDHGQEFGRFRIQIKYPHMFPERGAVPKIFLMSHREQWVNNGDSHIEDDWALCLWVAGESGIDFQDPDSFRLLIESTAGFLVRSTFYQIDRKSNPKASWYGDERAHGEKGIRQAIARIGEPNGDAPCLCGSGKSYARCHRVPIWRKYGFRKKGWSEGFGGKTRDGI